MPSSIPAGRKWNDNECQLECANPQPSANGWIWDNDDCRLECGKKESGKFYKLNF